MAVNEALRHPIAALLKLFNLQRIGTEPAVPSRPGDPRKPGGDDPFKKPAEVLAELLKRRGQLTRIEKYAIYEEMDRDPLVAEVLNAYAEAFTQLNYQKGVVNWTEAHEQDICTINDRMLQRVGWHETAFARGRDLAKFGDVFDGLIYQPTSQGIVCLNPYESWKVSRIEDLYRRLLGYAPADAYGQPVNIEKDAVPPYDILHIRLLSKDRITSYGTGLFDSSYEQWEDLQSMEDQVVLQRILRRPDRLVWLLDTTGLSLQESFEATKLWEKYLYKEIHVRTGSRYQSRGIPMTENRDLVLPKGPNNTTAVSNLPATNVNDLMKDLEWKLGRFLGGLGMPRGYFGFANATDFQPGQSLQKQDTRFARKAMRMQFSFLTGAVQLSMINLALLGLDPFDAKNRLSVNGMPISNYMEIEYNELLAMRFDLAEKMVKTAPDFMFDRALWVRHVLVEIAKMPIDLIESLTERPEGGQPTDAGQDAEMLAAVAENRTLVEHALLADEAARCSKAVSGPQPDFREADLMEHVEKAKAATKSDAVFAATGGEMHYMKTIVERAEDRVARLRLQAKLD